VTQDARESITAWAAVSLFVGLFALSLKLDLARFIPEWVVWVGPGLLLVSIVFRLFSWLWRRHRGQVIANG
jgi:protein-S-isoprenylcysteine O-methyltransferase Ste14